jgi:(2Fe-2S) ferredoxin
LHAILDELARQQIEAHVMPMDCVGDCASEPRVEVMLAGQPAVTYVNVRPPMASKIIEWHLAKGIPVQEWMRTQS